MDTTSIGKLLQSICVAYPAFKKECVESDGKLKRFYVDEWNRRIGFLTYEEADEVLTKYVASGERQPPNWSVFLNRKPERTAEAFRDPEPKIYHVDRHGMLVDEELREYVVLDPEGNAYDFEDVNGYILRTCDKRLFQGPDDVRRIREWRRQQEEERKKRNEN